MAAVSAHRVARAGAHMVHELVRVDYTDGSHELYQMPLSLYPEARDDLGHALVGEWSDADGSRVWAYDGVHDREATGAWLRAFDEAARGGTEQGGLTFRRLAGHDLDTSARSTLFRGEQSNSSLAYGDDSLLKVFRKVSPGVNPDVEVHAALTEAGVDHVAQLYGWLELDDPEGGDEPLHLAMLQQFLRTASDGWDLALGSVRNLLTEDAGSAAESGGDFAGESEALGVAVRDVHDALAGSFPTTPADGQRLAGLATAMTARLEAAVEVAPDLRPHAQAARTAYDDLAALAQRSGTEARLQRVHGDLHLGQTLRTTRGWKVVDFEGEPAKPLVERRRPDSPWRDVAGMLRSFDYAAQVAARDDRPDDFAAADATDWTARNQQAFLHGYTGGEPLDPLAAALLRAYEADKAVYEVVYETRNRPAWVGIPLAALRRLPGDTDPSASSDPQEDPS